MDAPRTLFEALKAGRFSVVKQWVDEGRQEDLYMDFKRANSPMDKYDRVNLAEALSGFANSDGGLIVWGVDADEDADGVDCAKALEPIKGLRRFLADLHENTARGTNPPVQGVEHFLIEEPVGSDSGYAVTYVPKAEGLPHMAIAKDQHRYYYRSGDSFHKMEHFMLADRFGRRPQPKLELSHRWERSGNKTYLVLGIKNVGRGIALYPALHVEERGSDDFRTYVLDERFQAPGDPLSFGLPERVRTTHRPSTMWVVFAGGSEHAIHPGTGIEVCRALGKTDIPIMWENNKTCPFL